MARLRCGVCGEPAAVVDTFGRCTRCSRSLVAGQEERLFPIESVPASKREVSK